ncbi:MAG: HD domain-containing protein [Pseudomonadota bacterium]
MVATAELTRETIIPFLAEIFARRGAEEYLGEPVSISEHMLQGAQLAKDAGATEEVIAAALLHDVGHFTHDFPTDAADQGIDSQHEEAGAAILAAHFPKVVVDCVRYHVAAKRYLCATDPAYFARLSEASVLSLKLQGGPMSKDEVQAFADNPDLEAVLQVRIWDDEAKIPGKPTPGFAHYAPLLQRVVDRHAATMEGV